MKFRPLRIKKGKVTVSSYMSWRKFFNRGVYGGLVSLVKEYEAFNQEEFVFNHKGEQLFFPNYLPESIKEQGYVVGFDCDKVPCFSHYTVKMISKLSSIEVIDTFEPLRVKDVVKWLWWLIYENETIKLK